VLFSVKFSSRIICSGDGFPDGTIQFLFLAQLFSRIIYGGRFFSFQLALLFLADILSSHKSAQTHFAGKWLTL
jgi:hypothetical protein